jgi:uncharacterized protein (DUF983 family)
MNGADERQHTPPTPGAGQLLARALRLRCPRCGTGRLFRKWFSMNPRCSDCGLKLERAPGYYLGATYINYGWTAALLVVSYLVMHNGFELSNQELTVPMLLICVLVPLASFRQARGLWLALDCLIDKSVLAGDEE